MSQQVLIGQATDEKIAEWKQQYPQGIYAIESDDHIAYFKNPNRNEMNCAMSKASQEKALDMYEELANLTFIGGSEDVIKNDQRFYGLASQLKTKFEGKKATLVNL